MNGASSTLIITIATDFNGLLPAIEVESQNMHDLYIPDKDRTGLDIAQFFYLPTSKITYFYHLPLQNIKENFVWIH